MSVESPRKGGITSEGVNRNGIIEQVWTDGGLTGTMLHNAHSLALSIDREGSQTKKVVNLLGRRVFQYNHETERPRFDRNYRASSMLVLRSAYKKFSESAKKSVAKTILKLYQETPKEQLLRRKVIDEIYQELRQQPQPPVNLKLQNS